MSSHGKRIRRAEPYVCGKDTPSQPGDKQTGGWSRDRLVKMNDRFVERVEAAIAAGKERRSDGEAPERAA